MNTLLSLQAASKLQGLFNKRLAKRHGLLLLSLAIAACGAANEEQGPELASSELSSLNLSASKSDYYLESVGGFVSNSESKGLTLFDKNNQLVMGLAGRFELLDSRDRDGSTWLVTVDKNSNQVILVEQKDDKLRLQRRYQSPVFNIDGLCLQNNGADTFLFLLDGEGRAEQWLLNKDQPAQVVRNFNTAPGSYCSVDDTTQTLYISEESVGIWAYDAHPEAQADRALVALVEPWGKHLGKDVAGLVAFAGGVAATSPSSQRVSGFSYQNEEAHLLFQQSLNDTVEAEALTAQRVDTSLKFSLVDKEHMLYQWQTSALAAQAQTLEADLTLLMPSAETEPMPRFGDVADDPAIWVNAKDPSQSLVLGSNKTAGLHVYQLNGEQKQFLNTGRLNNVDLRYNFSIGQGTVDIAVASRRDDNSLAIFTIEQGSGHVRHNVNIPTSLESIYGLCMYQDGAEHYVFANDKSGEYQQYHLNQLDGKINAELIRSFRLPGQPEGCVANDSSGVLFMGEEDAGVWQIGARADAGTRAEKILGLSEVLHDDVEGMAIYQGSEHSYLLVSSQGNNSYALFDTQAPFAHRGSFRIGLNKALAIDGTSETDGLDVNSANLGGVYNEGMIVVQDGHNVLPSSAQNFKYLPWATVKAHFQLD